MKAFLNNFALSTFLIVNIFKMTQSGFPLVFPLLTTGWYYKPGPVESIVLGLIVVKVLAIRLGATLAGVPYHLNDIFDQKNLFSWNAARGRRHLYLEQNGNQNGSLPLTESEIEVVERILLALRRIDSHDCFIQYICRLHQNKGSNSAVDEAWLQIFRLQPEKNSSKSNGEATIWDIYKNALSPSTNCAEQYSSCPLTPEDLKSNSLLAGMF